MPYDISELLQSGRERKEDSKPCVTCVTIILVKKPYHQTSPSFKQIFFLKDQKTVMLLKIMTKHPINNPITFVTHKHFAVLVFLPSCCINSLRVDIDITCTVLN